MWSISDYYNIISTTEVTWEYQHDQHRHNVLSLSGKYRQQQYIGFQKSYFDRENYILIT